VYAAWTSLPGSGNGRVTLTAHQSRPIAAWRRPCRARWPPELARMIVIQIRTVPDDGAERAQWVAANRRADGPALSRKVNDDLAVT